jgi:hypothetical protein
MGRPKFFELLDFPKFATPSVLSLQAAPTALNLRQRIGGGGFIEVDPVRGTTGTGLLIGYAAVPTS